MDEAFPGRFRKSEECEEECEEGRTERGGRRREGRSAVRNVCTQSQLVQPEGVS